MLVIAWLPGGAPLPVTKSNCSAPDLNPYVIGTHKESLTLAQTYFLNAYLLPIRSPSFPSVGTCRSNPPAWASFPQRMRKPDSGSPFDALAVLRAETPAADPSLGARRLRRRPGWIPNRYTPRYAKRHKVCRFFLFAPTLNPRLGGLGATFLFSFCGNLEGNYRI